MKIILVGMLMAIAAACEKSQDSKDNACIDESMINPEAICTREYDPVCGCDGKTYSNSCMAVNAGVIEYVKGKCPTAD